MPQYNKNRSRSNYYGINGVVDVLTSMKINKTLEQSNLDTYSNKIIEILKKDEDFKKRIKDAKDEEDYEIIIDYKGMKRPPIEVKDPKAEDKWENHKQQILTYSWLRSQQEDAKSIFAGIIFYLNELVPSKEDLILIQNEMKNNLIDDETLRKYENDFKLIENWQEDDKAPELSDEFKIERSIRIINIDDEEIGKSLEKFDEVVYKIEESLINEMKGCKIQDAWKAESDERTCSACDFRTFCKNNKNKPKEFKIP